jgi:acetyl esterase/lipase
METPLMPQPPYPLHPSVATRFAQQFIDYYSMHMLNAQQAHFQDLAVSRLAGRIATGSSQNMAVGAIHDLRIPRQESSGPDVPIRVFVPEGEAGAKGWPVILYYHGGSWVFGDIETENAVCTNLCVRARCVVITTDYR